MFSTSRAPTTSSIKARSGAALVLVLAALALISFLLIAITTLVQSENRGSYTAADLVQVRMLSQLPEKLVISQIRRATGTPDNLKGTGYTWTSQPGMIKVFGTTPDAGKPRAQVDSLYKLYSARKVKLKGTEEQDPDNGPIGEATRLQALMDERRKNPAEAVDLNEPVRVEPGLRDASNKPRFVFPIVDPAAVGLVDGFKVHSVNNNTPGAPPPDSETPPLKATADTYNPGPDEPRLAMPVTWLYVLQDGSVIPPDKGVVPGEVQFGGSGTGGVTPSLENPIVGRIAYWTDDESSKLNINTATEPSPWEPPHTHTTTDENYANSIPARNEFYRNSGHPAYTSLSPVLRHFGQTSGTATTDPEREPADSSGFSDWYDHIINWHRWLPRTFETSSTAEPGTKGGTQSAGGAVSIKQDRLFASVDEMIFTSGKERMEYNTTDPKLNPEDLSKVRFFLTTHNRAPELNLFGRPKISLWPLMDSSSRNETDKKFALASSIGADIYYFQRSLEWLSSSIVGSSQTSQADLVVGSRNEKLIGYLQDLSEREVPGFGGKFMDAGAPASGKWTALGRDQVLVSMFDFIRSGVNTGTPYNQTINPSLTPQYRYVPPALAPGSLMDGFAGGSVVPQTLPGSTNVHDGVNATKGFGRFPTISKVAIVFFATDAKPGTPTLYPPYSDQTTSVGAFVILEPFNTAPGTVPFTPYFSCILSNLNTFQLDNNPLGFISPITTTFYCPSSRAGISAAGSGGNASWGGEQSPYPGLSSQFLAFNPLGTVKPLSFDSNLPENFFMAASTPMALSGHALLPATTVLNEGTAGTKMLFNGGVLTLDILDSSKQIVQTVDIEFPPTEIPVPLRLAIPTGGSPPLPSQFAERFQVVSAKSPGAPGTYRMPKLIQPGDVVRSMELAGADTDFTPASAANGKHYKGAIRGDARLLAGRLHVKATPGANQAPFEHYLIPHLQYFDAENLPFPTPPNLINEGRSAYSLRDGAYMAVPKADGSYEPDAQIGLHRTPETGGALAVRTAPETGQGSLPYYPTATPATPPGISPSNIPPPASGSVAPIVTSQGATNADGLAGDFDNGPGIIEDGPYINMPYNGNSRNEATALKPTAVPPIYALQGPTATGGTFDRGGLFQEENGISFSPWRQISSAIAFGSLPTGVYGSGADPNAPRPWQTLLFCPNPASRTTPAGTEPDFTTKKDHFGFLTPRDHLLLENFWMPVVEPDGISEGFATEGKVNMNYQIVPFFWIKRASAMHGALHGVRITAIPSNAASKGSYKNPIVASPLEFRYSVDAEKTLAAFDDRFYDSDNHTLDVFRSPSEICEMFLIPKRLAGHTYEDATQPFPISPIDPEAAFPGGTDTHTAYKKALQWWKGSKFDDSFDATGDNLREAPYAQLYPRLCTRSNVFTVHYRVQVLRKSRSTKPILWDEARDQVVAEYRGQSTIERYLDPSIQSNTAPSDGSARQTVPDFASVVANESLDDYYKYRVTNRKRFSP